MNLRFLVVLSVLATLANGYNILVLGPHMAKSHFMFMSSFVKALIDRGHEVTYLTSNSLKNLNLANYTEVLIDPPLDLHAKMKQQQFLDMASASMFSYIHFLRDMPRIRHPYAYENSNVQKFIHSTGLHFDLVINEEYIADSFLMFAHKYKAPIVTVCAFGVPDHVDRQHGMLTPSSFVPHWTLPYSDDMSFYERWFNVMFTMYDWAVRKFQFLPTEEEYTIKYFAHLAPLPSLEDLHRNISLVLVNEHRALAPPRPSMPNVIRVGGSHIKPVEPLPQDIKKFIDDAKHGVIYFSLGTVVRTSQLPTEKIAIFIDVLKTLKQRVLWKFEDESMPGIPLNVMVRKWLPQNDILAHKNVILFISHGGLFGTTESLYHGVPLLFIPFFGDQFRNAYRTKKAGYGEVMSLSEITKDSFAKTINELIYNKAYLAKAKETSAVFKDNLVHPMDEAMFWIEHVAKFKGAKHLKSHAVNMSWFSYLLLDVLLVNVAVVSIVLYIVYILIGKLFSAKIWKLEPGKKRN